MHRDHSDPAGRGPSGSPWMHLLACPLCSGALVRDRAVLRCARGHAHSIAAAGWVDLQPPRADRPVTGDTAAMLAARARTASRGWFGPLTQALLAAVRRPAADGVVVDAGCGNGALLDALRARCDPAGATAWIGTDVSRAALRTAAPTFARCGFVRADTRAGLPLLDGSVCTVLTMFAPRNPAAFARVLRDDGDLFVVHAGPGHMAELRGLDGVLRVEPGKHERLLADSAPWFRLLSTAAVQHRARLDADAIRDLVRMGPSSHHVLSAELDRVTPGHVTFEACITRFVRRAAPGR